MRNQREAGYYWVKVKGCRDWTPVYWCSDENDWELSPDWFTDVCEVNENRLCQDGNRCKQTAGG